MKNIKDVIKETEFFIEEFNLPVIEEIRKIDNHRNSDKFHVSLVGCFSTGKTHFLNSILNVNYFSEAATPQTAIVNEVNFSELDKFCLSKNGKETILSIKEFENKQNNILNDDVSLNDKFLVYLNNDVLYPNIAIYDTPGVDDILKRRAELSFNCINKSDAVIVFISAISPFSLLEKKFISEYLKSKKVPHLAVFVNYLEKIPVDEVENQIKFIKHKLKSVCSEAELWCISEKNSNFTSYFDASSYSDIDAKIKKWSTDPQLQLLRDLNTRKKLKFILQPLINQSQNEISILKMDLEKISSQLSIAVNEIKNNESKWQNIERSFKDRGFEVSIKITDYIDEKIGDLIGLLSNNDLQKLRDVLQDSLYDLKKEISSSVLDNLTKDLKELSDNIFSTFSIPSNINTSLLDDGPSINVDIPDFIVDDTGDLINDLFNRYSDVIVNAIVSIIPKQYKIPCSVISKLLTLVKDNCFNNKGNHISEFSNQLHEFRAKFNNIVRKLINDMYSEILKQVKIEQEKWFSSQLENLSDYKQKDKLEKRICFLQKLVDTGNKIVEDLE